MLPSDVHLPDGPTRLLSGQPPHLLTAIVSGAAGTWHPGHALYCLWRWAQRRCCIPGIAQQHAGSTWMTGNRRKPSHPTNGRPAGPPQTTYAPSSRPRDPGVGGGTGVSWHPQGRGSTSSTYSPREGHPRRPPNRPPQTSGQPQRLDFPVALTGDRPRRRPRRTCGSPRPLPCSTGHHATSETNADDHHPTQPPE